MCNTLSAKLQNLETETEIKGWERIGLLPNFIEIYLLTALR